MKKNILSFTLLLFSLSFAQERRGTILNSSQMPVVKFSDDERINKPSLQDFVELIYINSVAVFEDEKSMYKLGEFPVYVFNKRTKDYNLIESKDVNQIKIEDIKSFKYSKNNSDTALFGSKVNLISMVWIELK